MTIQFPTVRGRKYDFSSIELSLIREGQASQVFVEITAVDYDDTLEQAFLYGADAAPLGKTRGQYQPGEATITVSKQTEAVLIDQLGDGYMEAEFDVTIKYSDVGLPLIVDTLEKCNIFGFGQGHATGPDPLVSEMKLRPTTILRNGKTPLLNHLR